MIVFMGTPEFSVPILKMLIEEKYNVGLVVTQPDRLVGRKKILTPSLVKQVALENNIEVFQPENLRRNYQYIIDLKPSLIITASYGQILPKELLEKIPAVNIHGSLLPKYRGGAPIQYALFNGDDKTGITLMEMVYKMDAGDMIEKSEIEIDSNDDYGSLSEKLSIVGSNLLKKRLPDILSNNYTKTPQNEEEVTFAFTLKYSDEALDFNQTSKWNHQRIKGLSPNIGAHLIIDNVVVKVFKSQLSDIIDIKPHEIKIENKRLFIGCSDKAIEILELQQAGKKRLSTKDYLNGQNLFINGGMTNE
ncbi:methionyl-tRNA formyltransferase [Acholeplasma granularum]|uniref:methionyl-tRNA formyltransferase n=1 Tax=Acholeplasma granularum TaxID=264635 RepID=UPI000556B082|nr:methionyl-tRNA formyltransferase [Acholeplasma granularum]